MIKFVSLLLFTVYTSCSAIDTIGAVGQDCDVGDDDNMPEVCTTTGEKVVLTPKIECEQNLDCCLCGTLKCAPECDGFYANGDFSAYYVPNIVVKGNYDSGAEIVFDGDSSGEGAVVTGKRIKNIKCGGDRSCYGAEITAVCVVDTPCKLECDGDDSCRKSIMHITNVEGVSCSDNACKQADITIVNPDEDFKLECGSAQGCKKADITIIVNGDEVSEIEAIDCGGSRSCKEANITIINIGESPVTIKEWNCEGDLACRHATFTFEGDIEVESCSCGDDGACIGATFTGIEDFTCEGYTAV